MKVGEPSTGVSDASRGGGGSARVGAGLEASAAVVSARTASGRGSHECPFHHHLPSALIKRTGSAYYGGPWSQPRCSLSAHARTDTGGADRGRGRPPPPGDRRLPARF